MGVVRALLKRDPSLISARGGEYESTPLHWAVVSDQKEIIKLLLEKGAEVDAKDNLGRTPVYQALSHPSSSADLAKTLLANGANANVRDNFGMTPLHFAATGGKPYLIELLVKNRSSVNARDNRGRTPLHSATGLTSWYCDGHTDVVRSLLRNGGEINARDNDGDTPLRLAMKNAQVEVQTLLEHMGAEVTEADLNEVMDWLKASIKEKMRR